MKALRFYAPEDVRLEDVPEPDCGPREVKIRVRNCSTCGTDVKILHNGHQNLTPPRTIGHEIAGEVVEVGADVAGAFGGSWQVGDRVQVIAAVPCGVDRECPPLVGSNSLLRVQDVLLEQVSHCRQLGSYLVHCSLQVISCPCIYAQTGDSGPPGNSACA